MQSNSSLNDCRRFQLSKKVFIIFFLADTIFYMLGLQGWKNMLKPRHFHALLLNI